MRLFDLFALLEKSPTLGAPGLIFISISYARCHDKGDTPGSRLRMHIHMTIIMPSQAMTLILSYVHFVIILDVFLLFDTAKLIIYFESTISNHIFFVILQSDRVTHFKRVRVEIADYNSLKMSTNTTDNKRKVTTRRLAEMKQRGEKISMLTSYDYNSAKIVDGAGIDVILVGDSASNVMAGNVTTLPITLDQMIYHAKSVMKGTQRALVVVDLPFGSYQGNSKEALASAIRIMKESHAEAVKMEGGSEIRESIERILCAGIPVMGHLGLTPQSINKFGTYNVRAREEAEAEKLIADAHMLEDIGCFAIVLEKIPAELARKVSEQLTIPTIGIGAGGGTDGQVLVMHDMLGINQGFSPRFLRRYADLATIMHDAIGHYVDDVKSGSFPTPEESY